MRARIGAASGLLAAAITMAGCSNDGAEPSTLPDTTASVSASPTESSAATATGDPTAQLEAEIAKFYELYVQTINESWTSAEALQRRREMFADSCESCLKGYELASRAQTEGLTLEAERGTVHEVRLDDLDGDVATFLVREDIPAGVLKDSDGNIVRAFGATLGAQIVFRAQRTGPDRWVIIASDVLSVEGGG